MNPSAAVKDGALSEEQVASLVPIDFVTLGMFIVDDIDFLPPTPTVRNVLGGAGTYSALGARLFSPGPESSAVGWIVDRGSDFPDDLAEVIESWKTTVMWRRDPERLTTRGWNGYTRTGHTTMRSFRYTTPKKRLDASDLDPTFLLSKSFHLICSPARCRELVADINNARKSICPPALYTRPIFIWEPVPDLCTPSELLNCTNTLPVVDVCSPNHAELAGFMGDDGLDPETGEISTAAIESYCEQLLASMPLQSFTLVVRAGEKGCFVARNGGRRRKTMAASGHPPMSRTKDYTKGGIKPDTDIEALFAGLLQDSDGLVAREEIEIDPGIEAWIPAFHRDPSKVVDPTGGGNSFLGGLAAALARGKSVEEAAEYASVSASFAIEQIGMPTLSKDTTGQENWNGVLVEDRLEEMRKRMNSVRTHN